MATLQVISADGSKKTAIRPQTAIRLKPTHGTAYSETKNIEDVILGIELRRKTQMDTAIPMLRKRTTSR